MRFTHTIKGKVPHNIRKAKYELSITHNDSGKTITLRCKYISRVRNVITLETLL